jgi:hypothetical protein
MRIVARFLNSVCCQPQPSPETSWQATCRSSRHRRWSMASGVFTHQEIWLVNCVALNETEIQAWRTVVAISYESNYHSQSRPQVYGWYAFCSEFLYGIVVVTWYLLAFAERAALKVLTKLEKTIVPPLDDLPGYCGASHIPFQDERASLSGPGERVPVPCDEFSQPG